MATTKVTITIDDDQLQEIRDFVAKGKSTNVSSFVKHDRFDRGDRSVLVLIARPTERGMRITIPATTLAQAIRNPSRQARLTRLIRQANTDLVPLKAPNTTAAGLLLARSRTSDIVDAHVVV